MIDRFTRWPEAIPISDIFAKSCARALVTHLISRFGVPDEITTDRGRQFTADVWRNFSNLLGIQLHKTTAYHPQANGMVERFHRQLKSSLYIRLKTDNWVDELLWILFGIQTTPKCDLKASSAELVYGSTVSIPGEFVVNDHSTDTRNVVLRRLRNKVGALAPTPASRHGNFGIKKNSNDIYRSEFVYFLQDANRRVLQPPYSGPYKVRSFGAKVFELELGNRIERGTVDRLKAAHIDDQAEEGGVAGVEA